MTLESVPDRKLPVLLRIVLYGQRLEDSATYRSLKSAVNNWDGRLVVPMAVWDNSLVAQRPEVSAPIELVDWKHQPANTGLVEAYNSSVDLAGRLGYPWILLLDQDTTLTKQFLESAIKVAKDAPPEVVAIAPKILVNGTQRSPNGHLFECPMGSMVCRSPGASNSLIFAINSGMLVRTSFVMEIGGYSTDFRLDAVDHWFCREVYRFGKKIAVLPDEFEHQLSVYNKQEYVSIQRFKSIMFAQSTFALSSNSWLSKTLYSLLLFAHALSQALRRPGKGYASLALWEWFRFLKLWLIDQSRNRIANVFMSSIHRLRSWGVALPVGWGAFPKSQLAIDLLGGLSGIEIGGAAHNDYGLNARNVDVVDHASESTIYALEQKRFCGRVMPVDLVAVGNQIPLSDSDTDFVLASHVIEHFFDPIGAILEWVRVSKRFVYIVVPHRDRTFDRTRPVTPLDELIERHALPVASHPTEDKHWSVWRTKDFVELIEFLQLPIHTVQNVDDKIGNGFTVVIGDLASIDREFGEHTFERN